MKPVERAFSGVKRRMEVWMTGDMNAVPKDIIRMPAMTASLPESTVGLRSGPKPMIRRPAMRMMKPIR